MPHRFIIASELSHANHSLSPDSEIDGYGDTHYPTGRGSWLPVGLAGHVSPDRVSLAFEPTERWQVTMLGGTQYRSHGLGWGAGGRVSRQGFGPVLTCEYGSGALSLRTELSATFRTPWADSTTKGQSITLGIGTAHHGREAAERH